MVVAFDLGSFAILRAYAHVALAGVDGLALDNIGW